MPMEGQKSACSCDGCNSQPATKARQGHDKKLPDGKALAGALRKFFKKQAAEVLGSLGKSKTRAEKKGIKAALPKRFIEKKDWNRELFEGCQPVVELMFHGAYKESAAHITAKAGIGPDKFNVTNEHLAEKVKALTLHFCEETNATTTAELNKALDDLRAELEEGLEGGDRMSDLADRGASRV